MNGQLNVTPITDRQPAPACHFSINAVVDGFPVTIEGEGRASDLRQIVDKLKSIGAEPPMSGTPDKAKSSFAPTCPVHNSPMKASQKPGTFFCPKKNDDGGYCRHKA